jgi:hypothetical protein
MKAFISSSLLESLDVLGVNIMEAILEQMKLEEQTRRSGLSQQERNLEDQVRLAEKKVREAEWAEAEKAKDVAIAVDRAQLRLVIAEPEKRASLKSFLEKAGVVNVEFASIFEKEAIRKFRGTLIANPTLETIDDLCLTELNASAKKYFWGFRWNGTLIPSTPRYLYLKGNEVTFIFSQGNFTEVIKFEGEEFRSGGSSYYKTPKDIQFDNWDVEW